MAPKRDSQGWKIYNACAYAVSLIAGRAYLFMLTLGVLHHDWIPEVPALGFGACLIVSMTLWGLIKR